MLLCYMANWFFTLCRMKTPCRARWNQPFMVRPWRTVSWPFSTMHLLFHLQAPFFLAPLTLQTWFILCALPCPAHSLPCSACTPDPAASFLHIEFQLILQVPSHINHLQLNLPLHQTLSHSLQFIMHIHCYLHFPVS